MNESMRVGKAGEYRVMSELLCKGFLPSLMPEISEADIILSNGKKIQVKSSYKRIGGWYSFSFKGWKRESNGKRKQKKHELKNVDFIILWAINISDFIIIPVEIVKKRDSYIINYYPERKRKSNLQDILQVHKNNWSLLDSREVV